MGFRPVRLHLALPLGGDRGISLGQPLRLGIPLYEHGGLLRHLYLPRQAGALHPARGVDRVAEQLEARLGPAQYSRGGVAGVNAEPHVEPRGVESFRLEAGAHLAALVADLERELSEEDGVILDGFGYAGHGDVAVPDRAKLEDFETGSYVVELPEQQFEKLEDLVGGAFRAPFGESYQTHT